MSASQIYLWFKKASRNSFSTFATMVKSTGYIQSKADYSLFTKSQGKKFTVILIYTLMTFLTGNDLHEIKLLKSICSNISLLKTLVN